MRGKVGSGGRSEALVLWDVCVTPALVGALARVERGRTARALLHSATLTRLLVSKEVVQALPLKPQRRATDAAETRYAVIAAEHHL